MKAVELAPIFTLCVMLAVLFGLVVSEVAHRRAYDRLEAYCMTHYNNGLLKITRYDGKQYCVNNLNNWEEVSP